jgi:tetratricopeptide (TPR) repeat protein
VSPLRCAALALALGALCACQRAHSAPAPAPRTAAVPLAPNQFEARIPNDQGRFYPSLARTQDDRAISTQLLADSKVCESCHQEAVHEWSASAHAHASFDNPWYRASVDALRHDTGTTPSRHCAGCHDPVLLFAGDMDTEVRPDHPYAASGVTCAVCHSVIQATSDGNASYTLRTDPIPLPVAGDAESLRRHRERVASKALHSAGLCASCHRGFLGRHTGIDHNLLGMDEPGAWRASAWGGTHSGTLEPVAEQSCSDCHMRAEPAHLPDVSAKNAALRSHRFPGGQTALAELTGDARQLEATNELLRSSVVLDVPVVWKNGQPFVVSDAVEPRAGDALSFDVTIRNQSVGHQFPGGVKDMQDTWLELDVRDARGRSLARAGQDHAQRDDASDFVLRAMVVDSSGQPEFRHLVTHFGSVAFDHTIPPLGARTVRYTLTVPSGFQGPLRVAARVRHRRHRAEARTLACEATRSERGQAFRDAAHSFKLTALDGCRAEPILEIASVQVELGSHSADSNARPLWARLYDHALGLSLNVQESQDETRWSANRALAALEAAGEPDPNPRARFLLLLGRVAARQGRVDEAIEFAARAEALVGPQPAIERVRADAYTQVWQFAQAAEALSKLSAAGPFDTAGYRDLARVRLSANDAVGALTAAKAGLGLQPRDEGLLRAQTLALEALKSPDAARARAAFLFYREADEATSSRLACDRQVATCARDRMPVVTVALTTPRDRH